MTARRDIEDITERIRQRADRAATYLRRIAEARTAPPTGPRCPAATSPTALPPARRPTRRRSPPTRRRTSASSPPTTTCCPRISPIETYPDTHQGRGARDRRHRAGRGRRAGHVRRRHPGPAGHGAVAVLARRDRHGDRDRASPQHVRRRGVSRHLRQDRAGPVDRRADLRPPAGGVRSGRPDALGHAQRRKGQGPPALCRGQGRPRRAARGRGRSPTTRRAPAPSTAPPIPTRC